MSVIYDSLTSVINRISDEFHKSLLFSTIFAIIQFFEDQWVNSYFKKFYPSENFLSFLNKELIWSSPVYDLILSSA